MITADQIRQKYLDFFKNKGHAIVPSASLLPENDPTTLFTSSGMQPMIQFLLGEKHPLGERIADSQKCFRAQDIDEVGDNRHTTFFEMLGNWSLGSYFKQEQILWMYEFLTKEIGLDPQRLYFTCFAGNQKLGIPKDTESADLWTKLLEKDGVDAKKHIFYYDETKNWWSRSGVPSNMPVGEPGGPDTEMFWDFSAQGGLDTEFHNKSPWKDKECHVNCDCGRFVEIGNNVFMEYRKTADGFEKLKQRNVDFGGGLERMTAAVNDNPDIFQIDLFGKVIKTLEALSKKKYGENSEETHSFRVILDHLRAATFLIADGAVPSNKDQGYFTRRLIRRAIRYAHRLGVTDSFCSIVAQEFIEAYANVYQYLEREKMMVLSEIEQEDLKFRKTLKKGLEELNRIQAKKEKEMETATAVRVDQNFSRLPASKTTINAINPKEAFDLYQSYGFPLELINEELARHAFFIDENEFKKYNEQHRELSRAGSEKKFKGGLADNSEMSVKYHTATHLLHAALQKILGSNALQRGSNITPERLRFDFSHEAKMTQDELQKVEDLVNAAIARDYQVSFQELTMDEAKKLGAIGLFEEKYGEKVKVYTIGDPLGVPDADPNSPTFSREVCGGPHVANTGIIGKFKIIKEEASSAGVRRIKAVVL